MATAGDIRKHFTAAYDIWHDNPGAVNDNYFYIELGAECQKVRGRVELRTKQAMANMPNDLPLLPEEEEALAQFVTWYQSRFDHLESVVRMLAMQ
jgi:hypothetical protein